MANVPYHIHEFNIPVASKEDVADGTRADVVVTPESMVDVAAQAGSGVFRIPSFVDAANARIPASVMRVLVEAYDPNYAFPATVVGAANYKRVLSEPAHDLKFNNGGWWEIDEEFLTLSMCGAIANGGTPDGERNSAALQRAFDYMKLAAADMYIGNGHFHFSEQASFGASGSRLYGDGSGATKVSFTGGAGEAWITFEDGTSQFQFEGFAYDNAANVAWLNTAFKAEGLFQFSKFKDLRIRFAYHDDDSQALGFDCDHGTLTYQQYNSFEDIRIDYADIGIKLGYESNAFTYTNVEATGCRHFIWSEEQCAGHLLLGCSVQAVANSKNQIVFKDGERIQIIAGWWEVQGATWVPLIAGNYDTRSIFHFGPGAQNVTVVSPTVAPIVSGAYFLCEGIRYHYFDPQNGIEMGFPLTVKGGYYVQSVSAGSPTGWTRSATGQTADLHQWKEEGGAVVAGISRHGTPYGQRVGANVSAGAAVNIDARGGGIRVFGLTGVGIGSMTIANPTGGQQLTLRFNYSAGINAIVWPTNVRLAGGSFTPTAVNGSSDLVTLQYDGSSALWFEVCRSMNLSTS